MPWFKNKLTGLTWEVGGSLAERLSNDPDYEPAPAPDAENVEPNGASKEKPKSDKPKGEGGGRVRKQNVAPAAPEETPGPNTEPAQ